MLVGGSRGDNKHKGIISWNQVELVRYEEAVNYSHINRASNGLQYLCGSSHCCCIPAAATASPRTNQASCCSFAASCAKHGPTSNQMFLFVPAQPRATPPRQPVNVMEASSNMLFWFFYTPKTVELPLESYIHEKVEGSNERF